MNDDEIEALRLALKAGHTIIFLHPSDDNAACIVDRVGEHPEEGKGHLCAIFKGHRHYAALSNVSLSDFKIATPI